MKNGDRVTVYLVGFVLGTLLVSLILSRRAAKETQPPERWVLEQQAGLSLEEGEALPEGVPDFIREGTLLGFGYLPEGGAEPEERVWLLNFDKSYPYVRVVQNIETGSVNYMAADQILIQLKAGVDVTELKPMLDALDIRLRMFNRSERIAVVGVLGTALDGVAATVEAVQPYAALFELAEPDWLLFKREGGDDGRQ